MPGRPGLLRRLGSALFEHSSLGIARTDSRGDDCISHFGCVQMSLTRALLTAVLSLASVAADATVVYSYQGNLMSASDGALVPGVSAKLEFSDDGTKLLGWIFSTHDLNIGVGEWSSEDKSLRGTVRFKTDAAGSVTAWELGLKVSRNDGIVDFTTRSNMAGSHPLPGYAQDEVRLFEYVGDLRIYEVLKNPGVWVSTAPLPNLTWASPVPESSESSMLVAGFALIACARAVRRRR